MNQLTCKDPTRGELLAAYEFGLLHPAQQQAFESHLESCDYCAEELFRTAPYAHELRTHPRELLTALARVSSGLEEQHARPQPGTSIQSNRVSTTGEARRRSRRWAFASGLALAAATLLVFLVPRDSSVRDVADLTPLPYVPTQTRAPGSDGAMISFERGMELYVAGRFLDAADSLGDAIAAAEADPSIRLPALSAVYLAVARLQSDRAEEAIPILEPLVASPIPAVSERARWYLAQAYLLRTEPEEARSLLRDLLSSPAYGDAAATQLAKLEE